jgi:ribosomal protein S18 acetylase RimI-like enzyme
MDRYITRRATPEDVHALVEFRDAMFRDMGWTDELRLAELAPLYRAYLLEHFESGDYLGWVACDGEEVVAAVGLLWERVPPTVRNLSGRQAYILAMYVRPEHRREGIASELIGVAVEHARGEGADVISLHASDAGRGLYQRLGFGDSPEMRLFLRPDAAAWTAGHHVPADDAD